MKSIIVNHPILIIIGVIFLTLIFGFGLRGGVELNVSPLQFIEKNSPERNDYNSVRESFGDDLFMVVALVSDDAFAPANLAKLRTLHEKIEKISDVAEIISLSNSPYARGDDKGVTIEKLIPDLSTVSPARLAEARTVALTDKLYAGQIISRDGKTASINILLNSNLLSAQRYAATEKIYNLAQAAGFQAVFCAGDPFMQWRGVEAVRRDLTLFLPLTLLLVSFLLWLCFRSIVAVILPLLTVGIGLVWVFGVMGYTGATFNILSLMLPTVLLAIGCSYVIHVFNQIGLQVSGVGCPVSDAQESFSVTIFKALEFISLPVVVSALTIIAGFLSLAFSKIPGIKSTSIYAALGAGFTMILSLTFVPAVLALLGERRVKLHVGMGGKMVEWLESTGRLAVSKEKILYVITGVMCALSVIGIFRVVINVDYYSFFKPNTENAIGMAEVGKRLAGSIGFEVIIEGDKSLEDPKTLAKIAELQAISDAASHGQSLSVVDFIKHGNRAFHSNDSKFYALPSEEKNLSELMSDREQFRKFITDDGKRARILVRTPLSGSGPMSQAIREIEAKGKDLLPDFRVYATGTVALMNRTSDSIAREQLQSVSIALFTIFLMLALLFKSFRVGMTALIPNLIPVLFFFGYMGWSAIPLNMTTSLVASVVLGLAVDNAVQFIYRFRRVQPNCETVRDAIVESMRLSGRPIIYANVAIAAAFAVFSLSNFWPVTTFGLLSAVTILACLVEDLVLLPARLTSPVFRVK